MKEGRQHKLEGADQISEEVIAEFVKRIEEKRLKRISDLLRFKEKLPIPTLEELNRLLPNEREAFLQFYGKFSAAVLGINQGFMYAALSEYHAAFDFAHFATVNRENPQLMALLQKTIETEAIYLAVEKDTNTAGGSKYQKTVLERLYKELVDTGRNEETNVLINPFKLQKGTILYEMIPEGINRGSLRETIIEDVILDGKNSKVTIDGKEWKLIAINNRLASGRDLMLRDGSNFFGDAKKGFTVEEYKELQPGQKIRIKVLAGLQTFYEDMEVLGTNEAELEAKYGKAYLPFRKQLLVVRGRNLKTGEEGEGPYSTFEVEQYL